MTGAKGSYEYSYDHDFPFFLSEPNCNGNEEHLIDCPGSEIENITSCYMTAVVICGGKIWGLQLQKHYIIFTWLEIGSHPTPLELAIYWEGHSGVVMYTPGGCRGIK